MMGKHEICIMQILLIAATEKEIIPFTSSNTGFDVLITGVGIPSVLYHLQKRIHQLEYDLIIQAGIAGTFDHNIPLSKTVIVKQDCFADLGIEENQNYTPVFKTEFADKDEYPFENGWLINSGAHLIKANLPLVKAITVNKVSDSDLQKQQFIKEFNADIETMEGAALHYVCLQENVAFLQMRSISNHIGERDKTKWKIRQAIENLNTELTILIKKLTN